MADTNFTDGVTTVPAAWLNDVNDHVYNGLGLDGVSVVNVKDPTYGAVGDGITDDAAAVQAAIDAVVTLGGVVYFPPGKYMFNSQVTVDRTYAVSGSNFVGERNLHIVGYGAELRTTGAIAALQVKGGWAPNHNCMIEGFTIYHRENTDATFGIRMVGAGIVTCRNITVNVSSSLPAGYAAFGFENLDPTDPDTGCFWCTLDRCAVRPWAGADGNATYGVKAVGATNALTLTENLFSGATTHVILMAHSGEEYTPNSVIIDNNFFEGPVSSTGINLVGSSVDYHVSGTRITNNRFESVATAVTLTGTGTTVQVPTYMSGNYADTSVTTYLTNSLSIPVVMLDSVIVGSDMPAAKFHNKKGLIVQNDDNAFDPLTVVVANSNSGLALKTAAGVDLGSWEYKVFTDGAGTQIGGSESTYRPLRFVGVRGLSQTDTAANNFTGTATFSASTSVAVTFPTAEANASYSIFLDSPANLTLWVTSKGTGGFTINSSSSTSVTVRWMLVR
jgi:hypothetical protein